MCTCKHGSDRHFLDYAGPGFCGGVLTRCLEKDCGCKLFALAFPQGTTIHPVNGSTFTIPLPPEA